ALREHTRARGPALAADEIAREGARIDPRELERGVGLYRRREIRRPLEPDRPGAVNALAREQLVRDLAVELRRPQAAEVVHELVLRHQRRVRLELADPPALGVLELEQPLGRAVHGPFESEPGSVPCECHTVTLVATSDNVRAAARPLRTAASMVGGQGAASHAPASASSSRAAGGRFRPGLTAIVASGSLLTRDQRTSAGPSRSVT